MSKRHLFAAALGMILPAVAMLAAPAAAYYHASERPRPSPASGGQVATLTAKEFAFAPSELALRAGTVTLRLENTGLVSHNLTIAELGKASPLVTPGGAASLSVQLKPGTYAIYCAVQGHRERGMEGTLVVTTGG